MPHHYDTYREELAKAYPGFGYALWEPDPGEEKPSIGVGDVGFVRKGRFHRLFNALLPADHPFNGRFGVPADHEPLQPSRLNHINRGALVPNTFHSDGVTVVSGGFGELASLTIGSAEVSFSCTSKSGAILTLPVAAWREDTVVLGLFRRWIIEHIDSWFDFALELELGIAMEDIILVTGCHRTRSWTNIAFNEVQAGAQVSLEVDVADALGTNVTWGASNAHIEGAVYNQGPGGNNLPENQCIFIRGYRAKRYLFRAIRPKETAETEPDPGRSDRQPDKEVASISSSTVTITESSYMHSKSRSLDPLYVLLEYIAKRAPTCEMAIVHDDDLERVLGVGDRTSLETLQPDVMMEYLQSSQLEIGVLSDPLLANDQFPRTGTEHKAVAMLSEQLKISDLPSTVSSLSRVPISTTDRGEIAKYHAPRPSSDISGLRSPGLTPLSDHPLRAQQHTSPPPLQRPRLTSLPPHQRRPHTHLPPLSSLPSIPLPPIPPQPLPPPQLQNRRLTSPPSLPSLVTSTVHPPVSTDAVSPSSSLSPSHTSSPPVSPSNGQASKRRLKLNPLTALRSPGNRRAEETARYEAEFAHQSEVAAEAARQGAEEAARIDEKAVRRAMMQEEARGHVKSHMQSLLYSKPSTEEELKAVFSACTEACKIVGLDFAAVLQEPLIEGKSPIYWAILNRPTTYGNSKAAYNSLVLALLDACRPLSSSTLAAVRLACTSASDNTLLQRLFRHVPELSPLSTTDTMLLAPLNESDVVDIVETRDGTGSFVAHIKILRFRLRMLVSKCAVVEFVASERIWALKFSVVETSKAGRTESKWLLSLELGEHSPVVCVDADLFIEGSTSDPMASGDFDGPLLAISFGSTVSELRPGRKNAITVRLDDGPMGPHLLNGSSALVDAKGALYAQLNARLVRPALSALVTETSANVSPPRSPEKHISDVSYPSKARAKKSKDEKVYTSLRRGGR